MTTSGPTYGRAPRAVFRWLRGTVLVMRSPPQTHKLGGAAAVVWMVLATPGTAESVRQHIEVDWPELGTIDAERVAEALDLLAAADLVIADPLDPEAEPSLPA